MASQDSKGRHGGNHGPADKGDDKNPNKRERLCQSCGVARRDVLAAANAAQIQSQAAKSVQVLQLLA